MKFQQELRLG